MPQGGDGPQACACMPRSRPGDYRSVITFFADYICPFSYLSLRGVERVTAELGVELERCAFELRPAGSPLLRAATDDEWAVVTKVAKDAGLTIRAPALQPRTRKAHEATKFAAAAGKAAEFQHAIFDAHFEQGKDIGRIDVLVEIGREVGLDPTALKVALDIDAHADEVEKDLQKAVDLEIQGTPAFVAGNDVRVGYLTEEHLRDWLRDK